MDYISAIIEQEIPDVTDDEITEAVISISDCSTITIDQYVHKIIATIKLSRQKNQ